MEAGFGRNEGRDCNYLQRVYIILLNLAVLLRISVSILKKIFIYTAFVVYNDRLT